MTVQDGKGNNRLIERLQRSILSGNVNHAYIFEGDHQTDKVEFAKHFVKAILCESERGIGCDTCISCMKIEHGNHEDVYYAEVTDKGNTKDEEIIQLQARLSKKPYVGERNIAIIKDADSMTLRAQNRLLKTLEEPPPGTVILLLSNNIQSLTSTILSRCVVFRLDAPSLDMESQSLEMEKDLVQMLLNKAPYYKIKMKMMPILKDKDGAMKFLDGIELLYRDLMILDAGNSRLYKRSDINRIIGYIEESRRDLQLGVNTAYALKNMMLKIGG